MGQAKTETVDIRFDPLFVDAHQPTIEAKEAASTEKVSIALGILFGSGAPLGMNMHVFFLDDADDAGAAHTPHT